LLSSYHSHFSTEHHLDFETYRRRKRRRKVEGENERNGEGWENIYRGNASLGFIKPL